MHMIANRTIAVPIAKRCMLQHRSQGIGRALTEASIRYVVDHEPICRNIVRVAASEHLQCDSKYGQPFTVWVRFNAFGNILPLDKDGFPCCFEYN